MESEAFSDELLEGGYIVGVAVIEDEVDGEIVYAEALIPRQAVELAVETRDGFLHGDDGSPEVSHVSCAALRDVFAVLATSGERVEVVEACRL